MKGKLIVMDELPSFSKISGEISDQTVWLRLNRAELISAVNGMARIIPAEEARALIASTET